MIDSSLLTTRQGGASLRRSAGLVGRTFVYRCRIAQPSDLA